MRETIDSKRERWKASLQAVQDGLWTEPTHPLHLYHYSSMGGIRGILESHELWLSDIRWMNDRHDGTYWTEVFSKILGRKSVPEFVRERFQRHDGVGIGEAWFTYVACFSPTSDLKYQWREYANQGAGGAIEFSFDTLLERANDGKVYGWTPMEYDPDVQRRKAEETIDAAISLFRDEREDLTANEARFYWIDAAFSFLLCGTRFKHPDYREEQEWRLFISRRTRAGADYRAGARGPGMPYLRLPFAPDVVAGIVKGSNCTCTNDELLNLLRRGGYCENLRTHVASD